MKSLIALALLTLSIITSANAQDLTPVDVLIKQGLQVKMGELTGAGSKFSIKNLEGLVLPEGVLLKSNCTGIVVKNSVDPKVSDIVRIKVQNQEIEAAEFVGFVVK
ncbi:MAG: hypothetical protein ACXVLQ_01940 [Bacteriovorax sp.]